LVEDNRTDVTLIRLAFAEHGISHELSVLEDGEQALNFLERLNSEFLPELIIMDLNLPKRDGIEVLTCIRNTAALDSVPVVVFTTSDSPRERESASTIGVTAYIRKPSDLDGFLAVGATIRQILDDGSACFGTHS
jgi:CheY-like chemotaxis protein